MDSIIWVAVMTVLPASCKWRCQNVCVCVQCHTLLRAFTLCALAPFGRPLTWHLLIIIFCARATFSGGISMARSPRATMMPGGGSVWRK